MKTKIINFISAISAILLFNCCVSEDLNLVSGSPGHDDDAISLKASISSTQNTRYFYDLDYEGEINTGTFYLTYPRNTVPNETMSYTKYDMATVNFGSPEDPTTGFASFVVDGVTKDLKWSNIKGEGASSVSLYLHNIDPDLYTISTGSTDYNTSYRQKYIFKTSSNPYVASPLDTYNGSNDLIICGNSITSSGGKSAKRGSDNPIAFNLFHRMALVKVDLQIFSAQDGHVINLDDAEVTITNLYTTLKSVNLAYNTDSYFVDKIPSGGNSMTYCEIGTRDDVTLVGGDSENPIGWGEIILDEDYYDEDFVKYRRDTYSTQPFVFPPQIIDNTAERPKIIVKVPKDAVTGSQSDAGEWSTYSGYLPTVMYETNTDGEITTPLATRLNSSFILHVTATIDSPDAELSFAPVKVEAWVSKGGYTLTTKKAGIYSVQDFMKLIEAYQNGRIYDLEKYGFVTDDGFVFQVWANIFLDTDEIKAQMAPELWPGDDSFNFSFILNNYTVTLDRDTDNENKLQGLPGQMELWKLVTGSSQTPDFGIKNSDDMRRLLSLCHASDGYTSVDKAELLKYGTLNSYDNVWEFYLMDDITLDFDEIYKSVDTAFLTGEFKFNRQGHSITVMVDDKPLICEYYSDGFDDFQRLTKIPTTNYGIYYPGDFYLLTKCYNNFYQEKPELLELFGLKSSSAESWTFYFRASMTLEGPRAFLAMQPDPDNFKPNYSFYTSSPYYDIVFEDTYTPFTTKTQYSYIYRAVSGKGGGNAKETLKTIISYYNANNYVYLWNYGKFENGAWLFPLTYTSTTSTSRQQIEYDDLFGKMQPSIEEGRYDFNFFIGSVAMMVNNVPEGTSTRYFYQGGTTSATYPNSENDLKRMAMGTYWDEEEDDMEP